MKTLLITLALLLAPTALAEPVGVLELERLDMTYSKLVNNRDIYLPYEDTGRDRYETDETWKYSTGVKFDLNLLRYQDYRLRWDNYVHGEATNSQFRAVTWEFRYGLKIKERVEIFYDHRSSHILDEAPVSQRTYGLHNSYGVELTFYKRKE